MATIYGMYAEFFFNATPSRQLMAVDVLLVSVFSTEPPKETRPKGVLKYL